MSQLQGVWIGKGLGRNRGFIHVGYNWSKKSPQVFYLTFSTSGYSFWCVPSFFFSIIANKFYTFVARNDLADLYFIFQKVQEYLHSFSYDFVWDSFENKLETTLPFPEMQNVYKIWDNYF